LNVRRESEHTKQTHQQCSRVLAEGVTGEDWEGAEVGWAEGVEMVGSLLRC
jgi:hypothetical protein